MRPRIETISTELGERLPEFPDEKVLVTVIEDDGIQDREEASELSNVTSEPVLDDPRKSMSGSSLCTVYTSASSASRSSSSSSADSASDGNEDGNSMMNDDVPDITEIVRRARVNTLKLGTLAEGDVTVRDFRSFTV